MLLANGVKQAITAADREVSAGNIRTLQMEVAGQSFMRRLVTTVLGLFAVTALLLAVLGIYGVMAYSMSQRTSEIGIRIAMGARVGDIVHMVLRQGAKLAFIGIGIGLAGSLVLSRLVHSFLFGVTAYDPITFLLVVAVLMSAALLACYTPARRAAKVDPMEALRYE
jgi:putative ABC transport system permease protein